MTRENVPWNIYKIFVIFETQESSTLPARSQQERWRKRKKDIQLSYIRWSNWEELIQVWLILLTHLCHCASKQRHKRHTRSYKQWIKASGLACHSGTRGNLKAKDHQSHTDSSFGHRECLRKNTHLVVVELFQFGQKKKAGHCHW